MEGCSGVTNHVKSCLPFRVWRIDTDQVPDSSDLAVVDSTERDRWHRCVRENDRNGFLKTRAALRRLLGRIVGAEPHTVRFEENTWGKPVLANKTVPTISFSVSHTDGLSIIAVSDGRRIGVDVEQERCVAERNRIASQVFGVSIARALCSLQDDVQDGAFLRLWTAAEAYVKANGTGFAGHEARIPLLLSGSSGLVRLECSGNSAHERSLSLFRLSLPRGFAGSLVIEGRQENQEAIVPELM
jgi:4'-phosphopantetheinyl transferase